MCARAVSKPARKALNKKIYAKNCKNHTTKSGM